MDYFITVLFQIAFAHKVSTLMSHRETYIYCNYIKRYSERFEPRSYFSRLRLSMIVRVIVVLNRPGE